MYRNSEVHTEITLKQINIINSTIILASNDRILCDEELEFAVSILDVNESPADSVLHISDVDVASMLAPERGVLMESVQKITFIFDRLLQASPGVQVFSSVPTGLGQV